MAQVSFSFRDALDRISLGGLAEPETIELRKDVSHPVRAFPSMPDLGECPFVSVFLCLHEAIQVMQVAHIASLSHVYHKVLLSLMLPAHIFEVGVTVTQLTASDHLHTQPIYEL